MAQTASTGAQGGEMKGFCGVGSAAGANGEHFSKAPGGFAKSSRYTIQRKSN